nr:Asp23/Gls24 family envelope stress response protein [Lachnoclostridium sp. Marseille-P6806]
MIRIADDVVAMIASYAAREIDGVTDMAGTAPGEWLGRVGYRNPLRGVKVEVEDGCVRADLSIVMGYGYNIPATSSKVQSRVKQAIENMTGLTVTDVNVRIAGITVPGGSTEPSEK